MRQLSFGVSLPLIAIAFGTLGLAAACGGPSINSSDSGSAMSKTFAGQNKCNPGNHDRPFVIEWDATDMSQFEALAANDVVFVKYHGCDLEVLTACKDDSVRGSLGSYKTPEWTSGSIEKIEIQDENDLYAKLPLGASSLGGRVHSGEQFHMEYFVAGVRTATRPSVFRSDVQKIPGCKGATHFVYGYNLGAFALGSKKNISGGAEFAYAGIGVGGNKSHASSAEKTGGLLGTCRSDSAKEIEGCKLPIRLSLRAIEDGDNPEAKDAKAPETDASLNAVGKLEARTDKERKASEMLQSANDKLHAHDGKACLAALDMHDQLDPRPAGLSTAPKGALLIRGQCVMASGQCDAGKQQVRKAFEASSDKAMMTPEQIDKTVTAFAGMYCQGSSMSARDQLSKASMELTQGAYMGKKDVSFCMNAYNNLKKAASSIKPKDDEEKTNIDNQLKGLISSAPNCLARAGDCASAYKVYKEANALTTPQSSTWPEQTVRSSFEIIVTSCKGK